MRRQQAKEQLNLIDADGNILRIGNRQSYFPILDGSQGGEGRVGFGMPTFIFNSLPLWIDGGSILQSVRTNNRELYLPINIAKCDHVTLDDTIRELRSFLNPLKGEIMLQHIREDGDTRFFNCIYSAGIEEYKDYGNYLFVPMVFTAFDPYWNAGDASSETLTGTTPTPFLPFEFPFILAPDNVWDGITVVNNGDAPSYPTFVCTGPGTSWEFKNNTTDKAFKIDYSLGSSDQMVITFDPRRSGYLAMESAGGTSLFSYIDQTMIDTWAIETRINELEFVINGTTGVTSMVMSYRERFL